MKKVSDFEKRYPLFVPYVTDEATRANMLTNEDLLRKYDEHQDDIQSFVVEIASRFDGETVFSLLQSTVFKMPDEILLSFIKAYLASNEAAKNNQDVIKFYNNILSLGTDSIHYVENHGIIINRTWRDIPEMVVDEEYNRYKKDNEIFKDEILNHKYRDLNIKEKRLVVGLLRKGSFGLLNILFGSVEITFRQLVALLSAKGINEDIINNEVSEGIGEYNLLLLMFALFGMDYVDKIIGNIRYLVNNKRFELLRILTSTNNVGSLNEYSGEDLEFMNDKQLINDITKKGYNLIKKDE